MLNKSEPGVTSVGPAVTLSGGWALSQNPTDFADRKSLVGLTVHLRRRALASASLRSLVVISESALSGALASWIAGIGSLLGCGHRRKQSGVGVSQRKELLDLVTMLPEERSILHPLAKLQ